MTAELVPFGKYKGQPVEVLAADSDYCEWLTAQPWFRERWPSVYSVVINYGGEPQDSPEHNQMQAAFLDDDWCFALADLLRPRRKGIYGEAAAREALNADPIYQEFRECVELEVSPAAACPRRFEDHGWDVVYGIDPASINTHRVSLVPPLPGCACWCSHEDCGENATCRGGSVRWDCYHDRCEEKRSIDGHHCSKDCYWHTLPAEKGRWLIQQSHCFQPIYDGLVRAELKPDLGDDYPSVLRQVQNYPHDYGDVRCVVARRAAFEHVTWDQVVRIFAASRITLLKEGDLRALADAIEPTGDGS